MVVAWGEDDPISPPAGAEPYKRDLKTLEYHLLDAGHFALETEADTIAMREFPSDIAFTPAVKAVQQQKGSRGATPGSQRDAAGGRSRLLHTRGGARSSGKSD